MPSFLKKRDNVLVLVFAAVLVFYIGRLMQMQLIQGDEYESQIYKGTVPTSPDAFVLDAAHRIERGRVYPVCGNTYRMLHDTRFAPHFDFVGSFDTHFGLCQRRRAGAVCARQKALLLLSPHITPHTSHLTPHIALYTSHHRTEPHHTPHTSHRKDSTLTLPACPG